MSLFISGVALIGLCWLCYRIGYRARHATLLAEQQQRMPEDPESVPPAGTDAQERADLRRPAGASVERDSSLEAAYRDTVLRGGDDWPPTVLLGDRSK